ncbi:MAG: hypothetical protein AAGA75_03350 [Cyanobacteria bacterium P01_E01_bin.6]
MGLKPSRITYFSINYNLLNIDLRWVELPVRLSVLTMESQSTSPSPTESTFSQHKPMNLFQRKTTQTNPETIAQLKTWVYDTLNLDTAIPVSISQLRCTEPGCPPLETVIAVMMQPPQTYKIHKPASDITHDDVVASLQAHP